MDQAFITLEYEVNSWANQHRIKSNNTVIASSFLFDASDDMEVIQEHFRKLVELYDPQSFLLISSFTKKSYIDQLKPEFVQSGYILESKYSNLVMSGRLNRINEFKNELAQQYQGISGLPTNTVWRDSQFYGMVITKQQAGLAFTSAKPLAKVDMYNAPKSLYSQGSYSNQQCLTILALLLVLTYCIFLCFIRDFTTHNLEFEFVFASKFHLPSYILPTINNDNN